MLSRLRTTYWVYLFHCSQHFPSDPLIPVPSAAALDARMFHEATQTDKVSPK